MSLSTALDNAIASLAYHKPVTAIAQGSLVLAAVLLLRRPGLSPKSSALRALAWGWSAPRLRFRCKPEVVVIELRPE